MKLICAISLLACSAAHADGITCLADNVYFEAAFEPIEGKVAVAQVTLNRAHGGDICEAVYARAVNPHTGKKEAAFSWTLGRRWRPRGVNAAAYWESLVIAQQVLWLGRRLESIGDAEYYHADYVRPPWRRHMVRVAHIGHHIFYRRP